MPCLLKTPESWMRENKRDLHTIEVDVRQCLDGRMDFEYVCSITKMGMPNVLDEWLQDELPLTAKGIVGPGEIGGWIEGGPISPYIDFDDEGLMRYIAEWEDVRQRAANKGFKRVTYDYSQWRSQLSDCMVFQSSTEIPQNCWWWDTPIGLLWSHHSYVKEGMAYSSASNFRDLWLRAQELYPALSEVSLDDIVVGRIGLYIDSKSPRWYCTVRLSFSSWGNNEWAAYKSKYLGESNAGNLINADQLRTERQQEICEWLGLEHEIVDFISDD